MSLFSIAQSLQATGLATAVRESSLTYPLILMTHLAAIALFGGMILLTDLRLLGVAMTHRPVSDVVRGFRPWKRLGFVIMVTCGLLLASAKAETYEPNPYFWLKMTLLALVGVHALVFRRDVYGNLDELDRTPQLPGMAKLAGAMSLVLWIGLVCAGRWIAYYEPVKAAVQAAR